jgi:hypothetical protein
LNTDVQIFERIVKVNRQNHWDWPFSTCIVSPNQLISNIIR